MSKSLNEVRLLGNVGQDPEVRTTQNGGKVATFTLATSNRWKNSNGEPQEKTEWHRCVVWNRGSKGGLADVVEAYVTKGEKLLVSGAIEYRQWQDKDNATRYSTEIKVNDVILVGTKAQSSAPAEKAKHDDPRDAFPGALDDDDDLPFSHGRAARPRQIAAPRKAAGYDGWLLPSIPITPF